MSPAARPATAGRPRPPRRPRPRGEEGQLLKGPNAVLAQYMDESLKVPTATSFRTLSVATLDAQRRQINADLAAAGRNQKLVVHAPDRLGHHRGGLRVAGHEHRLRAPRRQAVRPAPRERQPRPRRGRRAQGRQPHPDGAGHQGRQRARVRRLPAGLRRPGQAHPHRRHHARRAARGEHHAHQPRRHRHDRLGAAPDGRPGHDRRDRLDRLPAGLGNVAGRHAARARGREGHDHDLDLRPPRDPGRRVGRVPGARGRAARGRRRLLRVGPRLARPRPGGPGRRAGRARRRPRRRGAVPPARPSSS